MEAVSARIRAVNGIIQAIGKHVITQDILTGTCIGIGIDESAQFGIVVTGLEVVERGLGVLVLSTMPYYAIYTHTKLHEFRVDIFPIVSDRMAVATSFYDACPKLCQTYSTLIG